MTLRIILVLATTLAWNALGQTSQKIEVQKGKVVYVSGQDLVVKMADGSVKHVVVPKDFKFHVDGKDIGIQDLRAGTELTQTITTTRTDTEVTNVRNVDVTVISTKPPYVVVRDADGTNTRQVRVPDGTKFNIEGGEKTVFDLRPGMRLQGTVATTTPKTVVSAERKVAGKAPPTPNIVGVLLIEEPQQ
jgi:hypothetical protein